MDHTISFDELDHLSLLKRQKMLLESKLPLLEDESKRISMVVKKEDECCDLQGGSTVISARDARNIGDQQLEEQLDDTSGHLEENYNEGALLNIENQIFMTYENPTSPEVPHRVRVESSSILSGTLADGVDNFASAGVAVIKVKNEMFDDFDEDEMFDDFDEDEMFDDFEEDEMFDDFNEDEMFDDFDEDLDHVSLIERLRMLLSRREMDFMNHHVEDQESGEMIGHARMLDGLYYFDESLSSDKKS